MEGVDANPTKNKDAGVVSPTLPSSISRDGAEMTSSTSGTVPPRPNSRTTSAPTSPLKEKRASFLGKVTSLSQVVSQKVELARDQAAAYRGYNKDKCYTLLVIDDQNTDWSKYFRGKKLHGDWDIRVEQAEFKELTVTANSETGVTAAIVANKAGNRVLRSFTPDFLLVRQNLRDANEDYKSLLLGLQYGGVPSINSLQSIYNFQDRPWVYAHLASIQKKLGKENFPLIDQYYFPHHKEMVPTGKYPCVLKIGHAHGGLGKVRVDNASGFQDMASVVAVSNSYCTVESYIDAKYDLHIYKFGKNYRALMRKSLSGQWKTNMGQSILEEIPVTDRYKTWIDTVCEMFGGLAVCSLEAVVAKDGKEYIIEVNDSAAGLMGESQEEDRRHIVELVLQNMEAECKPPTMTQAVSKTTLADEEKAGSRPASSASSATGNEIVKVKQELKEVIRGKKEVAKEAVKEAKVESPEVKRRARRDSQDSTDSSASESSSVSAASSASSTLRRETDKKEKDEKVKVGEDGEVLEGEDTMKNLRKTFAGIFGDIQ